MGWARGEEAIERLQQVIDEDPNNLFAKEILSWFKQKNKAAPEDLEVSPAS